MTLYTQKWKTLLQEYCNSKYPFIEYKGTQAHKRSTTTDKILILIL